MGGRRPRLFLIVILTGLLLLSGDRLFSEPKWDLEGSWRLKGTHSEKGSYKGTATFLPGDAEKSYRLSWSMGFASGKKLSWSGKGVLSGRSLEVTFRVGSRGIAGRLLSPLEADGESFKGTYTLSEDRSKLTGKWASESHPDRSAVETLTRPKGFHIIRCIPDALSKATAGPVDLTIVCRNIPWFFRYSPKNISFKPGGIKAVKLRMDRRKGMIHCKVAIEPDAEPGRRRVKARKAEGEAYLTLYEVDLDIIGADGKEVPEEREETEGEAIHINFDDDDGDGGGEGHGETVVVSDKDDTDGVADEDDLLPLKVQRLLPAVEGATFKIEYAGDRIALYRGADKTGRLESGSELPVAEDTTIYVEGRSQSEHGVGETIDLVLYRDGKPRARDRVVIHVAEPMFYLRGHGGLGYFAVSEYFYKRALSERGEVKVVKGRDTRGNLTYYSLAYYNDQKRAKIALSTPGAYVAYGGHSNFGLGYAFDIDKERIADFMNIAEDLIPVNWPYLRLSQEHPDLWFEDAEYGDDETTEEKFDPVQNGGCVCRGKHGKYETARFFAKPVRGGTHLRLTRGEKKYEDHHYSLGEHNTRIVVRAGSADMPPKRWKYLYLHSCYAGQYYSFVFNHGTLFYTTDAGLCWNKTVLAYFMAIVAGKDKEGILRAMNREENINDYWDYGG
jgi:hypothetical protein